MTGIRKGGQTIVVGEARAGGAAFAVVGHISLLRSGVSAKAVLLLNGSILEICVVAGIEAVADSLELERALAFERARAGEAADVVGLLPCRSNQGEWQNSKSRIQLHFDGEDGKIEEERNRGAKRSTAKSGKGSLVGAAANCGVAVPVPGGPVQISTSALASQCPFSVGLAYLLSAGSVTGSVISVGASQANFCPKRAHQRTEPLTFHLSRL